MYIQVLYTIITNNTIFYLIVNMFTYIWISQKKYRYFNSIIFILPKHQIIFNKFQIDYSNKDNNLTQ